MIAGVIIIGIILLIVLSSSTSGSGSVSEPQSDGTIINDSYTPDSVIVKKSGLDIAAAFDSFVSTYKEPVIVAKIEPQTDYVAAPVLQNEPAVTGSFGLGVPVAPVIQPVSTFLPEPPTQLPPPAPVITSRRNIGLPQ